MVAEQSYIPASGLQAVSDDKVVREALAEQCGGDLGLPFPQRAQGLVESAGAKTPGAGLCRPASHMGDRLQILIVAVSA